jgi:hypothetical protein
MAVSGSVDPAMTGVMAMTVKAIAFAIRNNVGTACYAAADANEAHTDIGALYRRGVSRDRHSRQYRNQHCSLVDRSHLRLLG